MFNKCWTDLDNSANLARVFSQSDWTNEYVSKDHIVSLCFL